jgi:dihydrodipicolinate synthase/N-acetylneuraminate lyase
MQLPGLIIAPLTNFTADLDVDLPALRRQLDYNIGDCRATMGVLRAGNSSMSASLQKRPAFLTIPSVAKGQQLPSV